MLLLVLFGYISLVVAKKDFSEEFHVKSASNEPSIVDWYKEYTRKLLKSRENFTNCEEFLQNTRFDSTRVLNRTWQAFYVWLDINEGNGKNVVNIIVNFQLPNTVVIQRYQESPSKGIKKINWTAAEFIMELKSDKGFLFLATNKSGLFDTVTPLVYDPVMNEEVEEDTELMALKFVEPHYLGVMNCRYRQLLALAPVGELPSEQQVESVAKQFKFRSSYGISVLELKNKFDQANRQRFYSGEDDRDLSMNINEPSDNHLSII